ncbi:MAG: PD-(D/E)XK nuclease family protein, partial [Phycisphaerae bacterium]|nr:PD-(D/E)XK nuclease family protein [Phycisphaerae bacterium]
MGLHETPEMEQIAGELESMFKMFRSHPLWSELTEAAQVLRELDFVMTCPPGKLRGQIDLIYEDRAGAWHIVDYKSDRTDRQDIASHARRYELQMLLYAAAAARYLANPPGEARLYFLRTGATHVFEVSSERLREAEARAGALAERLIVARRSGRFDRAESAACRHCPYQAICLRQ